MPRLIGIDTGGTYTDAVVFGEAEGVIAKAKALTTHRDLSVGIGAALDAVLEEAGLPPGEVGMVSLSTTLATNAIVEGLGGRVCLVLIGFSERDLGSAGLRSAVARDEVVYLAGGHNGFGAEAAPLDTAPLLARLAAGALNVTAFAVAGHFSVANPGHELAVKALLAKATDLPVTCSHELSARLNGPKRALTSVLNARLIGVIHHLIDAAEALLAARSISAPLMVVKGDGSLRSAGEARRRPVETILSGPAASLVGARWLTGLDEALVADIGGTTTDVGILRDGRPRIDEEGAKVGGWATMVEAVAMRTTGLGGDSEVRVAPPDGGRPLLLGPRRVVPVSLLAAQHPDIVHAALDRQTRLPAVSGEAGRFALAAGSAEATADPLERDILEAVADRPAALDEVLTTGRHRIALQRLVERASVRVAAFSPSDAAHVLGLHAAWDREAARKAAGLLAGRRVARGERLAPDADSLSRLVIDALVASSADALLDAGLAEDGAPESVSSAHPLLQAAMAGGRGLVRLDVALAAPIVALGASAPTYYGAVAERLGARAVIPPDADVANAIGAVVGQIRVQAGAVISRPSESVFRAHLEDGPRDFGSLDEAVAAAEAALRESVAAKARASGADHVHVTLGREANIARIGDEELFLEMRLSAVGVGRPAFAA